MKANKAALQAMIAKAEEVLSNQNAYVATTIDGLSAVLESAKAVEKNDNAAQDAVDNEVRVLTRKVAEARLLGDVDGDGRISTSDTASLLRYAAEIEDLDETSEMSADVTGDGIADTSDAVVIMKYAAEMISEF